MTAGETPRGRCPPALCWPRTRRATGVTPRPPWGHPAPKPTGPSATGSHQSCHQALLPCSSLSSDASALPSRGCAAGRRLLATAGRSRGGAQALPFPPSPFSLLFPSVLLNSLFPSLSLSFSVPPFSPSLPSLLCPCPALCAGAGSLSFAPLTARTSQPSPRCWHCQPSPGPLPHVPGRGREGLTGGRNWGDTEGARRAGGGREQPKERGAELTVAVVSSPASGAGSAVLGPAAPILRPSRCRRTAR